jgi:hypothetical protein
MPMTNIVENDLVELLYQGKAGILTASSDLLDIYNEGCKKLGQESVFKIADLPASTEEAIKQWKSEKISCVCGSEITKSHKSTHMKSLKHIKFLDTIQTEKQ